MGYRTVGDAFHEGSNTLLYRGYRDDDHAPVVIKVPRGDLATPREIERLRHEHAILQSIDVPGVVEALALEPSEKGLSLVLEALEGQPLGDVLRARRLDVKTALTIASKLAGILGAVHRLGIVHNNVEPQNILHCLDTGSVHLVDFGRATRISAEEPERIELEVMEGALAYVAPEQTGRINRPVDQRADLYAFGVTLYRMLTATLPFTTTDPAELVHSHIARVPAAPHEVDPRIPATVSALVMKLLAKAPEDRYQTAHGVQRDLEACIHQIETTGTVGELLLGRHDRAAVLHLPQRLYGRLHEASALFDAFERTWLGAAELVLVAGPSGVGKSALVSDFRRILARGRGRFIAGKFDQLSRSVPFGPVIHAFRDLVQQILGDSAAELAAWKERLSHALGANGRVLVDLVPELATILGPQPPVPVVGPTESKNRMNFVLKSFVQVFTSTEHPLVLFLDDLQWADTGSLGLLETLLADPDRRRLLILGAYRESEVDAEHPLTATLSALRKEGVAVSEMKLGPLGVPELGQLLADALAADPARTGPLARAIHAKTRGNPFFVGQFLHALHEGGQIRFDPEANAWSWDIAEIEARQVTDNVVELIAGNIRLLAPETQRVLELAACIGHEFTLQTLSTIHEEPPARTADALFPALEEGLVLSLGRGDRFRFLHDRVQQAAYALIDDADRASTHLRIGRLLLAGSEAQTCDETLFEAVGHLNRGAAGMTDPDERAALASRNLVAGRRAKASNAYEAAAHHFRSGAALLPESAWQERYPLVFALHEELAQSDYLCGRFEQAEALFHRLVERAQSSVDRAGVYALELRLYQVAGKYGEAVRVALGALESFGITFPETDEAIAAATLGEMEEIRKHFADGRIEALLDAPVMTDPEKRAAMDILNELLTSSYIGRPALFPLCVLRSVGYSLRHGSAPESCYAYSCYALLLVGAFGDAPTAYAISEMSLAINERFGDTARRGRLLHVHGNHIHFWSRPFSTGFHIIERAFEDCLAVGEFVQANFVALAVVWAAVERGDALDDVLRFSERHAAFARQTRNGPIYRSIRMVQQFARSLKGQTRADRPLDDDHFRGEDSLAEVERANFGCGVAFYHTFLLVLHYMAGNHEEAVACAARARDYVATVLALPIEATLHVFEALALLARGPLGDRDRARIDANLEKLARWAEHCPENFEHALLLVQAEAARVAGNHLDADDLYDQAIAKARDGGFTHHEALANELAGRALLARGRHHLAPIYLRAAYAAYARWGAVAKAERLAQEHPFIVVQGPVRSQESLQPGPSASGGRGISGAVDMAAVLRLGQALAGEMELLRILEQLMRIVLSNAGAARGCLVLERDGVLRVEATIAIEPDVVTVRDEGPIEERSDLPASVIRYSARTQEAVVLGDVAADPRFANDPYLAARGVLSILCIPLVHRRRLVGVLYLENGLTRDAFSAERVELLDLICAQAATAFENALLYGRLHEASAALRRSNEQLEADVAQRTQDLIEVNARLTRELTERARAEQARAALQEEIIRVQSDLLVELSTPLIPITDEIMVLPLVGAMDARRAQQVMDTVLAGALQNGAKVVIMDITGMKAVDAEAASALLRTASALRLLGTQAWLTGVRHEVAQTFIGMGIDLGNILTFASLKRGFAQATRVVRTRADGRGGR
ncbi:AAA family ATPase [Polyangium aurulentum]|uniref:AAA family ATPase n=1 Tax=Polyangium aurulentum TaxID=2567896 RepID=UPI00146E8D58|nr:AAA family ATPase [Polyangium aurulentum]UQA54737.1 AAA family ATPase [Polyangium aurulentum]